MCHLSTEMAGKYTLPKSYGIPLSEKMLGSLIWQNLWVHCADKRWATVVWWPVVTWWPMMYCEVGLLGKGMGTGWLFLACVAGRWWSTTFCSQNAGSSDMQLGCTKQVWDRGECPPSNKTDLGMWYKCIHWQWWVCRALSSFRMCHMPVASTCILEFAYACLCMLMLQFSLAWSLHGSDINRIMAAGRCVGESTLPVKIGHAKAKTLCLMHLVQSVSKPRHHPVVPVVFALSRGMSLCEGCARQRW